MFGKYEFKDKITDFIYSAFRSSYPDFIDEEKLTVDDIEIEVPKDRNNGDFSTNTALRYSKKISLKPYEIAKSIVSSLDDNDYFEKVEIAGPGFINFYLKKDVLYNELLCILSEQNVYGKLPSNDKSVDVEYVSANPTGPLHIGNARGGAIGDVLANAYAFAGYNVTKEFYLNDAGNQIEKFGESLDARLCQLNDPDYPFPEDGYMGDDIKDLVNNYLSDFGDSIFSEDKERRMKELISYSLDKNITNMKKVLDKYGVTYDVWFSESVLHNDGSIKNAIDLLASKGATYEEDGALWFKAKDYDCEKDEVLIRKNGIPTYYAADIAYHLNKLVERNFDLAVNVWGADHHGHVHRLKMALAAAGVDPERLQVILMQLVHLVKGGQTTRMSKRRGDMVTLDELIEDVSTDSARFIFNQTTPNSHLDFDLDLAIQQSNDNPVFYVQYAHARMCSIIRNIGYGETQPDLTLLSDKTELALIDRLSDFTDEIVASVSEYDPSRITRYAYDVASLFHSFYNACRVNVDDEKIRNARLALVKASKIVLKNTLDILGVNAPESM